MHSIMHSSDINMGVRQYCSTSLVYVYELVAIPNLANQVALSGKAVQAVCWFTIQSE